MPFLLLNPESLVSLYLREFHLSIELFIRRATLGITADIKNGLFRGYARILHSNFSLCLSRVSHPHAPIHPLGRYGVKLRVYEKYFFLFIQVFPPFFPLPHTTTIKGRGSACPANTPIPRGPLVPATRVPLPSPPRSFFSLSSLGGEVSLLHQGNVRLHHLLDQVVERDFWLPPRQTERYGIGREGYECSRGQMTKKGTTRETRRREERKGGRMDLPYVLLGFSRVAEEEFDFGGAEVLGINLHKDMLPT